MNNSLQIFGLFLTIVGLLSLWVGPRFKYGWLFGFYAQPIWILYYIITQQYAFVLSALVYSCIYYTNYKKSNNMDGVHSGIRSKHILPNFRKQFR